MKQSELLVLDIADMLERNGDKKYVVRRRIL